MLILSRNVGQAIRVGDDVTIMITRITGNQVRIGIIAPPTVKIHRGELPPSEEVDASEPSVDGQKP